MYISVVIPSYNSTTFIEKALISVCEQSYQDFEIVISDDASSDKTLEHAESILKKYPEVNYQLLANEHSGPGGTRNLGIQAARYEWVAFLDSDDYWDKDKLQQVVTMIQETGANFVFHNEIFYRDNDEKNYVNNVERYNAKIHPFLALFRRNFLSTSAVVSAKSLLINAGLFDTDLHYAEDYNLWLRIALLPETRISPLNAYLGYYFLRSGGLTSNTTERLRGLLLIVSRYRDDVIRLSPTAHQELLRFTKVAYTRCGWAFCKQGNVLRGLFYIVKGLLLPFSKKEF